MDTETQRARAGDLAAAERYEQLAALAEQQGEREMAAYRLEQAAGSRVSAERPEESA